MLNVENGISHFQTRRKSWTRMFCLYMSLKTVLISADPRKAMWYKNVDFSSVLLFSIVTTQSISIIDQWTSLLIVTKRKKEKETKINSLCLRGPIFMNFVNYRNQNDLKKHFQCGSLNSQKKKTKYLKLLFYSYYRQSCYKRLNLCLLNSFQKMETWVILKL